MAEGQRIPMGLEPYIPVWAKEQEYENIAVEDTSNLWFTYTEKAKEQYLPFGAPCHLWFIFIKFL
ncbi:hypothetical protein AGMMS49579_05580 [Spirochaetia bacterium]|nr:hypothetical protein AGMMS49579_05580 [Spirochaetia bacterium]